MFKKGSRGIFLYFFMCLSFLKGFEKPFIPKCREHNQNKTNAVQNAPATPLKHPPKQIWSI